MEGSAAAGRGAQCGPDAPLTSLGMVSAGVGGVPDVLLDAGRTQPALSRGEQAPDRMVDLTAHEDFVSAAQEGLRGLHERLGLDLWLVAAVDSHGENPVAARQLPDLPVPAETVRVWRRRTARLLALGGQAFRRQQRDEPDIGQSNLRASPSTGAVRGLFGRASLRRSAYTRIFGYHPAVGHAAAVALVAVLARQVVAK